MQYVVGKKNTPINQRRRDASIGGKNQASQTEYINRPSKGFVKKDLV